MARRLGPLLAGSFHHWHRRDSREVEAMYEKWGLRNRETEAAPKWLAVADLYISCMISDDFL